MSTRHARERAREIAVLKSAVPRHMHSSHVYIRVDTNY